MTSEARPGRGGNLVGAFLERRYRIDSLIARGGMSAVYRGVDSRLHRPVAIKVMDSRYSSDRSFIDRFKREAQAAARLHHPNVVAVYDQGVDHEDEDDEHVYLVMQLVEGCTLRDLLHERGTLPLPLALTVVEPMLSAVSAAHEAGMVHRDIKPENVLIGNDGSVMVADFGLVRAAASAGTTSGSVILGTVAYLSPEQVTTGAADARTDVYAAGVVLYEMLTGHPPYTGDTALSVAYRHVNDDVPAPSEQVPELPPAIDDLVMRATRREQSDRPENGSAFLAEVRRIRTELGMSTVPVPIPSSEQRTALVSDEPIGAGPPTDEIAPVPAGEAVPSGGPRGTRAISRPAPDDDQTQDMAAVADAGVRDGHAANERSTRGERRRGRPFAIWTAVVLVLAALIGGTAWWLGSPSYVAVPRVTGEPEEVAQQTLRGAGLSGEVTKQYDNTTPEGTVVEASPAQGTQVLSGNSVTLTVSLGRPKVPRIEPGTAVEEAESTLRDAKLRPHRDESADQYHPSIPAGQVIDLAPTAGTPVELSSEVTLVVSKGPRPVPVPSVTGSSKDQAFAALRDAGFEPYEAGQRFAPEVEADHVVSTEPAAGTELPLQGKPRVGVVVSNAVTVPRLTGTQAQQAQQQAARMGLQLQVRSFFNRPNALILQQEPKEGTKVEPGATIQVTAF